MNSIGIVGMGFVGTAVMEGMNQTFNVIWYDRYKQILDGDFNGWTNSSGKTKCRVRQLSEIVDAVDGPIFVCVPTPMCKNGSCDVSIVEQVVDELNAVCGTDCHHNTDAVLIIKSTVPPGTTERLNQKCIESVRCVFNPEFLREASFVEDFKNQDHIIIGGPHDATAVVKQMYQAAFPQVPTTKTGSTIAEMVKYVTNTFLAVKVSFANEIAELCKTLSVDYDKVVEYATKDARLGMSHWSVPGPDGKVGFSGSCFPKDLNALIALATKLSCHPNVMQAAWETNLRVRPEKDWEQLKGRAVKE